MIYFNPSSRGQTYYIITVICPGLIIRPARKQEFHSVTTSLFVELKYCLLFTHGSLSWAWESSKPIHFTKSFIFEKLIFLIGKKKFEKKNPNQSASTFNYLGHDLCDFKCPRNLIVALEVWPQNTAKKVKL